MPIFSLKCVIIKLTSQSLRLFFFSLQITKLLLTSRIREEEEDLPQIRHDFKKGRKICAWSGWLLWCYVNKSKSRIPHPSLHCSFFHLTIFYACVHHHHGVEFTPFFLQIIWLTTRNMHFLKKRGKWNKVRSFTSVVVDWQKKKCSVVIEWEIFFGKL